MNQKKSTNFVGFFLLIRVINETGQVPRAMPNLCELPREFCVEFLSDAPGTIGSSNEAGAVTAEELYRPILCAQQILLSEVLDVESWIDRIKG